MLLDTASFLVRERASLGSALADTYDLLDADTGSPVGTVTERPTLSVLRFVLHINWLPTRLEIREPGDLAPTLVLHKRWSVRRGYFDLLDQSGRRLATFYTPWLSHLLFKINGPAGLPLGECGLGLDQLSLSDLTGWKRRLLDPGGRLIGTIEKEWAGTAKELLTSSDHYRVTVAPDASLRQDMVAVVLAACLVHDILSTEQR